MSTAAETRKRLIEQGRLAFADRGHDGVSLHKDILEPAGVSTGSFYHQFDDKTDLLVAILEEASRRGQYLLSAPELRDPASDPATAARHGYRVWFELIDGAEDLFRIQMRERYNRDERVRALLAQVRGRWIEAVAANLAARNPDAKSPFDRAVASQLIAALSTGVLTHYLDTAPHRRAALRESLIDALADFTIGGLAGLAATSPS